MFSVILPTLQRSPLLLPLLELYRHHPLVEEVLVINNAGPTRPLPALGPKVRVLHQDENIYVNPAWNLGAREARAEHLLVSNDDITLDPSLLDAVAARLRRGGVGMVGPHPRSTDIRTARPPLFLPTYERRPLYGVLFFLPREHWVPIPDDLLVWCGDDWLFSRQTQRNYSFLGPRLQTPMAVTSGLPEFSAIKHRDLARYRERYAEPNPYQERFGREARLARRLGEGRLRVLGRTP